MVVDGDEVDEEGSAADEGGEEEGGHQHLSDPDLGPTLSYVICVKGGLHKIVKDLSPNEGLCWDHNWNHLIELTACEC